MHSIGQTKIGTGYFVWWHEPIELLRQWMKLLLVHIFSIYFLLSKALESGTVYQLH